MVGEVGEQHAPAVEAPVPPVVQLLALTLRHLEAEVLEVVVGQQLVAAPASRRVLVQTSVANIKRFSKWNRLLESRVTPGGR